jgi:photosystem II stability/assembly factor-like uncharacterized protein
MKPKSLILISAAIIISILTSFKISYSQTSGPMASNVYSLAFSGSSILAGTESGIFKSSDNGKTWFQTTLYNQIAQSICSNGEVVIAGLAFMGMYRSADNGSTWQKLSEDKNFFRWSRVTSIGSIFFVGTNKGVFASEDNGQHWTHTSLDSGTVYHIISNASVIFAATERFGIFASYDNGLTWKLLINPQSALNSITCSGSEIYFSTQGKGILRSIDYGESWVKLSLEPICLRLCISGSNILAGTNKGLYVSSDKGESWTCTLADKSIISIVANDSFVFSGTWKSGLYVSSDNGLSWAQTSLINLEIKPAKFKKKMLNGNWDDYIVSPLMAGNLVMIAFSADSFFYHNVRYSDVYEKPCSPYVGEEFASGEFSIDDNFICLSGYWTDNTYKNILTDSPCNNGEFGLTYQFDYYSNHMLHLKLVESANSTYTGVKSELYLYKK